MADGRLRQPDDDHLTAEASTDGRSGERLGATALTMGGLVVNPFKGLRPFGEADAADFFGRDQLVGELHQLVIEQRFTRGRRTIRLGEELARPRRARARTEAGRIPGRSFHAGADPFDAFSAALTDLANVDQARQLSPGPVAPTRRAGGSR